MLKFYQILRTVYLASLVLLLVLVMIMENIHSTRPVSPDSTNVSLYETARAIVLYDPYDADVLLRVNASSLNFKKNFHLIANSVSDLITNAGFYNNVFIFMVSKKAEGISGLISQVFTNIPSFSDLVIIDRDRNVIYKHGNASITIGDFDITNDRGILLLDREIAVLGKYRDATLDNEIRIVALFSTETVANSLKEFPYPAFLIISNRMYRNAGILPDIIRTVQQNLSDEREYYTGLTVVRTYNITAQNMRLGMLGIAYPARSVASILLIVLKIIAAALVLLALFGVDRSLRKRIRKAEARKKENRSMAVPRQKTRKKETTPEEEEAAIDMRLDWFQDYVKDQDSPESKSKKDKEEGEEK